MASATKFISALKLGWSRFIVGEYSTTLPVLADSQRGVLQMDAGARVLVAGKQNRVITVAPTVTAGAYTANWVLGGKMTFANALRLPSLSGTLKSLQVNSKSGASLGTVTFWMFNADPASSTVANGGALAIHANDFDKLIGAYDLGALKAGGTPKIALLDNIGKAIQAAGTSLYGVMTVSGTPSPGSTADISASIGIEQD